MEIKVGDKVLLKKKSKISSLNEWLGKVVTVKTILKKDPVVFEFEEGEDIKASTLIFFHAFDNILEFDAEPTKVDWALIDDVEKVIEPKVEVKKELTEEEIKKYWEKDIPIVPSENKQKVYVVMAKGVSPSNVIEYHLIGVCSTKRKAEELEYAFNNGGTIWLKTFIEVSYVD